MQKKDETSKNIGVHYRRIVHILLFFQTLHLIQKHEQIHERYAEIFKAPKLKSFEGAVHNSAQNTDKIHFTLFSHTLIHVSSLCLL